jgi:orotate phosphoribosyltransferase
MELSKTFEDNGIIKKGHFLLTSGRHSDTYINKNLITTDGILFNIVMIKLMCNTLEFKEYNMITGPATAGAVLAAALAIMQNRAFIYPEKEMYGNDFNMKFKRGYDKIMRGKNILLIEDIITTGGSVQKTIDSIEENGGNLIGVLAIWNRSGWKPAHYKIKSLINDPVQSWAEDECPLCKREILLTDPKK